MVSSLGQMGDHTKECGKMGNNMAQVNIKEVMENQEMEFGIKDKEKNGLMLNKQQTLKANENRERKINKVKLICFDYIKNYF